MSDDRPAAGSEDRRGDTDFPLPVDPPADRPLPTHPGSAGRPDADLDDWPELTLRDEPNDPPVRRDEEEPYDGSIYGLGPATELPDLHPPPPPRRPEPKPAAPQPAAASKPAPPPAVPGVEDEAAGVEEDEPALPPPARRTAAKRPAAPEAAGGAAKPKLRDWLAARCKREAQMYALGVAALAPVAAGATGLTWFVLLLALPGGGWVTGLLAAVLVGLLFWVERVVRESRSVRLRIDPEDRDIPPVSLKLPRGAGLTWLMYLAGSRDQPGVVRFIFGILLFGPRLCELVFKMGRTAKRLWQYDADAMAEPLKTLVKAEGKVSFGAFLEAHRSPPPQTMMDRLALVDGVLFLPTSNPPGLCTSGAMKDEFAAWRETWKEERASDAPLYD